MTARAERLFVSWISFHGRSADLAQALDAECAFVAVGTLTDRRTAPLRHLVQALQTVVLLARRRPAVLLVMAPPPALVLVGLLWRRLTGGALVVDAHSGAVLGMPLSGRLARRADLVVVTLDELASDFPRAVALHDPPLHLPAAPAHGAVVFPASWYSDEPYEDVLGAARLLPDVEFVLTGKAPGGLAVPPNVRLSGHLPVTEYQQLLAGAAVVLALTTRESTMQRAAYEAVSAGRPVVASGTRALRGYLGDAAVFTTGGAEDLAEAVRTALARAPRLAAASADVRTRAEHDFAAGLARVAAVR